MPEKEKPEPVDPPERWNSAAEELERLLPRLQEVAKASTCGRAKSEYWPELFLKALGHCANQTIACQVAGISHESVRQKRLNDPEFAQAEKDAIERGIDLVEASAFKSAVYGDLEPVYNQGVLVGHVLKYSDAMRALLLKGRRSHVFRENLNVTGEITHNHLTLDEAAARIAEVEENHE